MDRRAVIQRQPRQSTTALAVATLVVFTSMVLSQCAPDSAPPPSAAEAQVVFSETPARWFDAYFTDLNVAPDGSSALFDRSRLVDVAAGTASPINAIDTPGAATFDDASRLVVVGRHGDERGWFRAGEAGAPPERLEPLAASELPVWSRSGAHIARVSLSGRDSTVRIGTTTPAGEVTTFDLPAPVAAVAWLPGDTTLLALVSEPQGLRSLHAIDIASGQTRQIAGGLDGPYTPPNLAVSDDGHFAYVALASGGVPDPEDRHVPNADRDLDIYRIDLGSGEREAVVQTPTEEVAPAIANGSLYWVSLETQMEAVIVPVEGGPARVVAEGVQGPTWRPDSRALGVTTGNWRLADWALNLDGGVVEIDADGRATGPVTAIITGYHEDFSPVWSPDGSWIAYHSHRSASPAAEYAGPGIADDIFLRRPDAPTSEEIRLTDFGWEVGTPDWAPDGRRLIMGSWNRNPDASERTSVWIIEIDPQTGQFTGRSRVPLPTTARGSATWEAWSPTRDEIAVAFSAPRQGGGNEVWVLSPDGTGARQVITYQGHQYGGVDWSADGEAIIYSALVDGRQQLFSVARSGGEPRQLTDEAASLFHPRASPDGRWVAATRMRTSRRILRQPLGES